MIFAELPQALQALLPQLSVYRLPISLEMAQALQPDLTRPDLVLLASRGLLLNQDTQFILHPLVEELVRARLTNANRTSAHSAALSFYQANVQPWDGTLASCQEFLEAFYHAAELGQYQQAYDILDRCFELLDRAGYYRELLPLYAQLTRDWQPTDAAETQNLGWAWTRLGNLHRNLGNYPATIAAHQQAQTHFTRLNFLDGNAAALNHLGNAAYSLGDYPQAISYYQQSLAIERAIGNKSGEANSLNNLGIAADALGDYPQAIAYYQQALDIQRAIGNKSGEASSLGNLGNAADALGDYPQAIAYYQQSLDIFRAIGDKGGEASSLNNLGNAAYSLGDYAQAIAYYQQSLDIQRAIGNKSGEASSLSGLGNTAYSLGDYAQAISYHQQSLDIFRAIGDRRGVGASLFNLALAQAKLDDPFNALRNFQQAKVIYTELKLDHKIEECDDAIRRCNQIIAAQRRVAPPIKDAPTESVSDWYRRESEANRRKPTRTSGGQNSQVYLLLFGVGLAVALLVWWLRR